MIQKVKISVDLALGCLSPNVGVWSVFPPCNVGNLCWVIRIGILGFKVSLPICGCWVIWLGFEVSPPICWCLVIWLGFEVAPPVCGYWVAWLGFEVSCRPNMRLCGCSNEVSSLLMGFSAVMGVMGLELELLAWVLALGSLCSLPSDLNQILSSFSFSPSLSL